MYKDPMVKTIKVIKNSKPINIISFPKSEPELEPDPIDEYKVVLNNIKGGITKAGNLLRNIDLVLNSYDPDKHSPGKLKVVIKDFNNNLRDQLRDINIKMMRMDNSIDKVMDNL